MKVLLGLPTISGQYDIHVIKSILNQLEYITESKSKVECCVIQNTLIHNARQAIAKAAIERECDYLLFIDSDCVIPENSLKTLIGHNKDIVSGMYFHKKPPFAPVIYKENDKGTYDVITDYPKDLIPVDGIGMGICLIKTSVLKELGGGAFEPIPAQGITPAINGEDLAFCKRAKRAGFEIFVDTSIQAAHQTTRYIDEEYYLKAKERMKEAREKEEK